MIYYYTLFTIFVIILSMMVVDPNVSDYIILLSKISKINLQRTYWMIRFHPIIISSPISKWLMMRKYMKIIKQLSENNYD